MREWMGTCGRLWRGAAEGRVKPSVEASAVCGREAGGEGCGWESVERVSAGGAGSDPPESAVGEG